MKKLFAFRRGSFLYEPLQLKHLLFLLLLTISTANIFAQNKKEELDKYFTALSNNQRFNGNVLVAENGKIVYEKSFGYADFANKKLNTNNSQFCIASITKTFTATGILQLYEKGKLGIDDPVSKYLTAFPYPEIKIRHLLSHTSGLPSYDILFDSLRLVHPDTVFTNKDIVARYAALKLPLKYLPGDNANYDNLNYIFLSLIIESVTGMPYNEYIKKNVFEPAGMKKTFFPKITFYHYSPEEKVNLVETYNYPFVFSTAMQKTDTIKFVADYWLNYQFKGFGEIITTTEDLLRYDQALYNGKLLLDATLAKAYTLTKLNNGKDSPVEIGLGWKVYSDNPYGQVVGHTGGLIGLSAVFMRNITKHQTVILFDNTQNRTEDVGEDALKILNGGQAVPLAKSAARIYGRALVSKGIEAANIELAVIQKDSSHYSLVENEVNILGYDLMANNKLNLALAAFKKNVESFPLSWNVYDSYGEALLENGQKEEAIKMYKKSIELNPENENGVKVLKDLSRE